MAEIRLKITATSTDYVIGTVPDDLLEQYYYGAINEFELYKAMENSEFENWNYEALDVKFVEEA